MEANLAIVAEFNAARKILTRQLEAASIDPASIEELRGSAVELQATALLLRAVPPIPEPTAALEFRASLDAFGGAVNEILRSTHASWPRDGATTTMLSNAALFILQSTAHYRAATEAINDAIASRVDAGSR